MTEALIQQPTPGDLIPRPDPTALTAIAVTQAKGDIRRELASQKEIIEARIGRIEAGVRDNAARTRGETADMVNSLEALLTQRIAGLEQILKILDRVVNNGPEERDALRARLQTDIKIAVDNLRNLHEERFAAIGQQFAERDTRGEQEKRASQEALNAALLAQKESVAQQNDANTTAATKTETNFTKQIDLVGTQITALDKSLTDRISELKERIDRGEGQDRGQDRAIGSPYEASVFRQTEESARQAAQRAVIAQVVAVIAVLASVVSVIVIIARKLSGGLSAGVRRLALRIRHRDGRIEQGHHRAVPEPVVHLPHRVG